MPIKMECTVFIVKLGSNKDGVAHANIDLINKKTKSIISLFIRDIEKATNLQAYEDEDVVLEIELKPFNNAFYLGNILSVEAAA